jgi:transcriptional regulator of heat shock response
MNERTAQILEAVVQEFIKHGEPISSGFLYDHYEFGIKPAMIRLELDELEEQGYLEQPHTSAGRIPTNRGFEFFAERMLGAQAGQQQRAAMENKRSAFHEMLEEQAWPDLINELSVQLGALSIVADLAREAVYKAGLERLVDQLDWRDANGIRSVIHDFMDMDERLPQAAPKVGDDGPKIFIGKKSPLTRSEQLSVIGGNYSAGGERISIFVIGPKRMDYKKVINIFMNL